MGHIMALTGPQMEQMSGRLIVSYNAFFPVVEDESRAPWVVIISGSLLISMGLWFVNAATGSDSALWIAHIVVLFQCWAVYLPTRKSW